MRVLFLGGTSFTGPHAVRELVANGHEVTVVHRGESEPELPAEVQHVHGDVSAFDEIAVMLRALKPDVVVDMLAFVAEEGRRVHAFRGVAERALVVSSLDVYQAFGRLHRTEPGPAYATPLTESSPLREVVIDESYDKVGVERVATGNHDLPVTILRYPAVHGPGDPLHRLYRYVRRMDDRRPAILLDEQRAGWRWARSYAEDVGHALALAVQSEQAAGRVYNVAAPTAYTEAAWVRKLADAVGWEGKVVAVAREALPESLREDADFTQQFDVDSTRIRAEVGYAEVVDERTALERTIAWERANPPEGVELDYETEDAVLASLG